MRWRVIAVAALLVVSGCNALGGGGGGTPTRTLTPAPVPSVAETPQPSPGPTNCVAPPVASDDRQSTPTPPTATRPLPNETTPNGSIPGSALVADHARVLENHSYTLEAGQELDVTAAAGGQAFTLSGVVGGLYVTTAYAVGGTVYIHARRPDGDEYLWETPVESTTWQGFLPSLTGREWLSEVAGPFNYTHTETRSWNGTTVRVLEARLDTPATVGLKRVESLHSTVLVDRRGIIRYVDHYERFSYVFEDDRSIRVSDKTFRVSNVGSATIRRPSAFCGVDLNDIRPGRPSGIGGTPIGPSAETETNTTRSQSASGSDDE